MPKLEPLVKNATQKISDPEARGVAEKAYKTLQKAAGEGAQSLQQVTAEAAKKQALGALGRACPGWGSLGFGFFFRQKVMIIIESS
jgi:hypothetical protein